MALHQVVPKGNQDACYAWAPGLHFKVDIASKNIITQLQRGGVVV